MKIDINSINLKAINDPSFVKELNKDELVLLSSKIREEILNDVSKNGGHLSSNLGVVELTLALYKDFDFTKDKLLFDVGHQCYTHKILTGRDLSTLKKKDGISGFIKCNESKYDVFEAGHSSTSLSAAYGFALDRDNKKLDYEIIALIGDASIVNGVAFEALNNIATSNHKVIIILNDNDMSITNSVGAVSNVLREFSYTGKYKKIKKGVKKAFKYIKPLYKFARFIKNYIKRKVIISNLFSSLGYEYIGVIDGHDFNALSRAFKKAKHSKKSVMIHVNTVKGKGYSFAESDEKGTYHGIAPFDIKTGKVISNNDGLITYTKYYSSLLEEEIENNKSLYLISPATLTGANLIEARRKHKRRIIDVGIAEEHAFVLAATLAKLNYKVVISIYSTFMQRSIDQISHDIARINSPVIVFVDHSGFVGSDGETHQGIYDEAYLYSTPNVEIAMSYDLASSKSLFKYSMNNDKPLFIRVPVAYENNVEVKDIEYVDYIYNKYNNNNLIITLGPLGYDLISKVGNKLDSILLIKIRPIKDEIIKLILTYKKVFIYTPYETKEGLANYLTSKLIERKFKGDIFVRAIPNKFISQCSINEQLKENNLDIDNVKKYIEENI